MAFRLEDFGIPAYDTNVNFLYKHAVETGESISVGDEEYVVAKVGDTPVQLVLRFGFENDGETPKEVVAHTFLKNPVRWEEGIKEEGEGRALVQKGAAWLRAEVINDSAQGKGYTPMIYPEKIGFGKTPLAAGCEGLMQEGVLAPGIDGAVSLLARVVHVQPIIMSKLWVFSVVELALDEGSLFVPVARDVMEGMLKECTEGDLCYLSGPLTLKKTWA